MLRFALGLLALGLLTSGFCLLDPAPAQAAPFRTFITGSDPGGPVIFDAVLDPAVPGTGSLEVVVGSQVTAGPGGRSPTSARSTA